MIPDRANELADVIRDIGAEGDEYANTVIPLIERMLADDYRDTGLFERISEALSRVEQPPIASVVDGPACGSESPTGLNCSLPLAHHGLHRAESDRIDPETGKFIVLEEWHD